MNSAPVHRTGAENQRSLGPGDGCTLGLPLHRRIRVQTEPYFQSNEQYRTGRRKERHWLWNGRNYEPGSNQKRMVWGKNSSDSRGRIIEMDSYLAFDVPSLLAHEALHAYLNSINWPGTRDEQEDWVGARETECAG